MLMGNILIGFLADHVMYYKCHTIYNMQGIVTYILALQLTSVTRDTLAVISSVYRDSYLFFH